MITLTAALTAAPALQPRPTCRRCDLNLSPIYTQAAASTELPHYNARPIAVDGPPHGHGEPGARPTPKGPLSAFPVGHQLSPVGVTN